MKVVVEITMNINDFESHIDDTILSRGLGYFKDGNVISLEYNEGEWLADVEGSDDYTVSVTLSNTGEILESDCDCPYDWGEYCKHQAAVFYALRKRGATAKTSNKNTKKENLETILKALDKQELLSLLLEFADRDRCIKEELLLRFSEKKDVQKYARGVIRGAVNAASRRGYVEYRDTRTATKGADTVLEMIDDEIAVGDIVTAVKLCVVVTEEMMSLLDCCDDSDGCVGGAICEAIEKIGKAVNDVPAEQSGEKLFDVIYNHALNSMYNGWADWRMDILSAAVPLCGNRANREKLERYISERQNAPHDGWSGSYEVSALQKLQYQLLQKFDGEIAATDYLERNLDNSDFRRIAIETAIAKKDYDWALALCEQGEQKDVSSAGLVREWRETRYRVYEKTKDVPARKLLARKLLVGGNFEYYHKLNPLYSSEEWPTVVQELLEEIGERNYRNVYVEMLIHEKLKLRLLEYCKKNISTIVSYYTHLLPECKQNVGAIFALYISKSAERANDRKQYREVCGIIKHYKKACGTAAANAICAELAVKYAKRPAFLDELRKV
jgi:hypothetical protein